MLDCMRGACARQVYNRKALGLSVFALGVCDEAEVCQAMTDQVAPYGGGGVQYTWEPCIAGNHEPNPGIVPGSLVYQQTGDVYLGFTAATGFWNPAICFWNNTAPPGIPDDCRSFINVQYHYSDSFQYSFFDDIVGCTDIGGTYNTGTLVWDCWYSRRVQPTQFMAVGAYQLVLCTYPYALNTVGPLAGPNPCMIGGGTVCSADGLTNVGKVPTTWQPPSTINVQRLC